MIAIDGLIAGVTTIGLSGSNITLTAPAGFVPTPGAGPTQAQNSVLRFTGVLLTNLTVTLPLPGRYLIENLTTGNFTVQFFGNAGGQRVSTAQGSRVMIYNDGVNCYFMTGETPGELKMWAGLTALPSWVAFCTTAPWLLCDGSILSIATYPYLGARIGSSFGGNGVTTFGVPDLRGRVPLAYDGTGTRITIAGCGINGQVLGASADAQSSVLLTTNMPAYTPSGSFTGGAATISNQQSQILTPNTGGGITFYGPFANQGVTPSTAPVSGTLSMNPQGGIATPFSNVQPSQVVGIWVIKT